MANEDAIKKLKHILLTKDPILFTGAGFSLGAKRSDNKTFLPSGKDLKMNIIRDVL